MSGFVVIFEPLSPNVDVDDLEPMFSQIRHRGPDAEARWVEGSIGMAAALLRATPEALAETQPFVDPRGVVVVFDGRLDDRDSLARRIGTPRGDRPEPQLVAD